MRLATVSVNFSYVVDLDNQAMVDEAIDCLWDDIQAMVIHNPEDFETALNFTEDIQLKKSDIPSFLAEGG